MTEERQVARKVRRIDEALTKKQKADLPPFIFKKRKIGFLVEERAARYGKR